MEFYFLKSRRWTIASRFFPITPRKSIHYRGNQSEFCSMYGGYCQIWLANYAISVGTGGYRTFFLS